jgi:hypothetical protein
MSYEEYIVILKGAAGIASAVLFWYAIISAS